MNIANGGVREAVEGGREGERLWEPGPGNGLLKSGKGVSNSII